MPIPEPATPEARHEASLALYQHLDGRVTHLDSRVTQLTADTSAIIAKLDTVASAMDEVSKRVHAPSSPTNWIGLVGAVATLVIVLSGFVQMRVVPVEQRVRDVGDSVVALQDIDREHVYEQATVAARMDAHDQEVKALWKAVSTIERDMIDVREKAAASIVSRKAIGDYVKKVDEHGSVKWNGMCAKGDTK